MVDYLKPGNANFDKEIEDLIMGYKTLNDVNKAFGIQGGDIQEPPSDPNKQSKKGV